jgi:hypothetical protein
MDNNEGDIGGNSGGSGSLQSVDSHNNNNPYTGSDYMNSTGAGTSMITNDTSA